MKIVFILDFFPPIKENSSKRATHYMVKELISRGHEVFVITSVQDRSQESVEIRENLKVFYIYSNYHPRWRFWLSLYNPQTVFKVKKIIKEVKPDVVNFRHIHQYLSYYCFKIAKKYSKAVFLTANDVMLFSYEKLMPKNNDFIYKMTFLDRIKQAGKRYNPFRNLIICHYLRYIDKIFTISNAVKDVLKVNGIKNEMVTIYNGIDIDEWQENKNLKKEFIKKYNLENKKIVLFGGRLSPAKGAEVILRAIKLISEKISNVILLINGNKGWYGEEIDSLIKKLDIRDRVIFTGLIVGEELNAAYHSADVCTLPSLCFEAFGMTGLEAMACAKPLVGTCFGGTPEMIIDGKTGYVVNPSDIDLLAEKFFDLLKNSDKAKKFGEAGYNLAKEKFSIKKQIDITTEQYCKFL